LTLKNLTMTASDILRDESDCLLISIGITK
jgi:hypothetical protein